MVAQVPLQDRNSQIRDDKVWWWLRRGLLRKVPLPTQKVVLMIAFTCSHGAEYTEWDLELGMRQIDLDAIMEAKWRRYQLEQDLAHEEELARQHVYDELDCPWPWYANDPNVVIEPQVFGP